LFDTGLKNLEQERCWSHIFRLWISSCYNLFESGVKQNFWLHAMCACTELYSTYQIRWENYWL